MTSIEDPELAALRDSMLASCAGLNAKDVGAWLDPFHDEAVSYDTAFMRVADVRTVADSVIAGAKSFDMDNIDGRIVDDRPSSSATTATS